MTIYQSCSLVELLFAQASRALSYDNIDTRKSVSKQTRLRAPKGWCANVNIISHCETEAIETPGLWPGSKSHDCPYGAIAMCAEAGALSFIPGSFKVDRRRLYRRCLAQDHYYYG